MEHADILNKFRQVYDICIQKVDQQMLYLDKEHLYAFGKSKDGRYDQLEKGLHLSNMWNWTMSFSTGLAPLLYRTEKKTKYLNWANTFQKEYHDKIFYHAMETMHDIGFLYSPYSVAMYQLTGDQHHKEDALKAADELLKRFEINGRYIDAFRKMDEEAQTGRPIVDCMMNIQLLFWAWKESGHTIYKEVAKAHADTICSYFIREDDTICHAFEFDKNSGKVIREAAGCGYGNGSYWARGTAWMIYGLAMTARYLEDEHYCELAVRVLNKYLSSLDNSLVPIWDFRLPKDMPAFEFAHANNPEWDVTDVANCKYNVDTSAAAIVACAMIELDKFYGSNTYRELVKDTLEELCDTYFNRDADVFGMLSHQNGEMVYAVYGDYYFLQALQQYLYDTDTCW